MHDPVRPRTALSPPLPVRVRSALALAAVLGLAAAGRAADLSTPSPEALVAKRLEWLAQVARGQAARAEADAIAAPGDAGKAVRNFEDPAKVLNEVRAELDRTYGLVRRPVADLATAATRRREEVQKDWEQVSRQRVAFRQYADEQQAAYGFDFDAGSQVGFRPTWIDGVLLGCAAVVLAVALRLRRKERRLDIRRAARAAAAGGLAGLCALPGCGSPPAAADARPWAVREEADLTARAREAAEGATAAAAAADKKWTGVIDAWANMVAVPPGRAAPGGKVDDLIRQREADLRDRLRPVLLETALAYELAKDAEGQRGKLDEEKEKLAAMVSGATWRTVAFTALRVAGAVALFGLCVTPYWRARRARARARRRAARTCPRCTAVGTLRVERVGADPASKYRGKGKKAKAPEREPEDEDAAGEVQCAKCGLRFRRSYLKEPRLCFPTVGVRSSGKTHMLATAYNRVVSRTVPAIARVRPAASAGDGAAEKRFEQFINLIMHMKGEAGATDRSLPDPVLIQVKDADPAGPSSALVNLFDYSGELVNPDVDVNQLKKTAVRMDGFMLFLDPTQLYGDGANVSLNQQLGMLNGFLADMQRERRIPLDAAIPVPVAVCIPKFDLLLTENPIGGQSVPFIRHMLDELTPSIPKETTLDTLRARSDLVEQMLPLMFPGVDIREVVEGYFGKQVMFFPMTSVNLIEGELGKKDLAARSQIIPYGVAEPIVWLLHMHGYEVFAA